jgi:dihydroflavonol-4-reductase
MILEVARGFALIAPPGGNDFVDVRDVTRGILAAMERGAPGRRYILGGEQWTYLDAWRRIARIVGARGPILAAPAFAIHAIGAVGALVGRISGTEPTVNRASANASCGYHWFSSKRAEAELGYVHGDVERAIADAWADFRRRGLAP